jgi:hypothetical protein
MGGSMSQQKARFFYFYAAPRTVGAAQGAAASDGASALG